MASLRARELRRNMTPPERRLWAILRRKRLSEFRFRRQQQIGPYIADFFCPRAKLIVEVDGGQHGEEEAMWYDWKRTKWLESRGYRVLRFWNVDVMKHRGDIACAIECALAHTPSGQPAAGHLPPQGGKENA
jgi:very-short-patch-repair endonuclease